MNQLGILLTILFCSINTSNGYKILGIFPSASPSHYITGGALMKALAGNGHEITVISAFPQSKPVKNFRDIHIDGLIELMGGETANFLEWNKKTVFEMGSKTLETGVLATNFTLQHKAVKKLLHSSNESFDVIVLESFLNEAMLGLGHHFNAPIIGFSPLGATQLTTDLVGSPSPLSYVPNPFLNFTDRMTFWQRLVNTLLTLIGEIMYKFYYEKQLEIYNAVFTDPRKPDLNSLVRNVSLVLLNTHFTLGFPRPYVPNMIEVGGLNVNWSNKRQLPPDIQQYLDSAENGAIYFSMGSNIRSSLLPRDVRDDILKVFSKLKQKVLWKWEDEMLPGKPANVFISKWFPQDDILAHRNVKLFITHGGLLGLTETIYHGLPIIGIPIFGDQSLNMAKAVNNGYGLSIKYPNLSEASLSWAVNEMLSSDKYSQRAKELSTRYRDQPMAPLEKAVYWVEYVARHNGAPHLHSAGQDLHWIAYHNLDVFGFLTLLVFAILYGFKRGFRVICKRRAMPATADSNEKKRN